MHINPDTHRTVYLAGPITGRPNGNREAFASAALVLRHQGFQVVTPHELEIHPDTPWEHAMPTCVAAMMQARALVVLRGWRFSRGAQLEAQLARNLGWPVVDFATLRHVDWPKASEGI
jgi:nucleoside 2-deoxyribosyltransferase